MTAPDPGLTDLIAAALGDKIMHTNGSGDRNRAYAAHVALVVEQHTNGRIAELEAELEKYHAEERRELEWDRFCAQQDVRCTECGLRYGERKDYTCPHIGEHKYDADELRAALEGES
ncbi:hypothetical protein D4768_09815 [Rhodococcus erythropolis]|uniref:hypothetical protein n=1 Tax=Rhodococcus erythropolis TaxID=1833 RepID=UPI001F40C4AD|nr:hypothetical protein [Rhodococcus erythropolis]UJC77964.1 hypothetical protein D4768_09815 [Rhodococcus erythropolis]